MKELRKLLHYVKPYWQQIHQIIAESDVVLYILDSRLVEYSRNHQLEEMMDNMTGFVFHKSSHCLWEPLRILFCHHILAQILLRIHLLNR